MTSNSNWIRFLFYLKEENFKKNLKIFLKFQIYAETVSISTLSPVILPNSLQIRRYLFKVSILNINMDVVDLTLKLAQASARVTILVHGMSNDPPKLDLSLLEEFSSIYTKAKGKNIYASPSTVEPPRFLD